MARFKKERKEKKQSFFGRHKILTVLLVLIVIVAIGSMGGGNDNDNTDTNSVASNSQVQDVNSEEDDNVSTEFKNALKKAQIYSDTMHMSKIGIYNQLISEYGEQFPADAAQYAIDNVKADWKLNALEKAKVYQKSMSMSKNAIYDQLISEYGEQFTADEAQYAIDNLE